MKTRRTQPEAAEKCWQQAANSRTKCRPRCNNKYIKHQIVLQERTMEDGQPGDAGKHPPL